jgi:tRNA-binding protein
MANDNSRIHFATFEDFLKLEIRVGRIVKVERSLKAKKPAYKLWLDFGEQRLRMSSAQITALYPIESLKGRLVLAVTNFRPKQVADVLSEVLVLGVPIGSGSEVVLIRPDQDVPLGSRVL